MPEIPVTVGAAHVYVVPIGTMSELLNPPPFQGEYPVDVPEHIGVTEAGAHNVTSSMIGFGLTVTVTVNDAPGHEPDNGVTV
jgi:hypothetical protein